MKAITLLVFLSLLSLKPNVWAWGGRGHDSICEAAVFLVKNKELKEFLTNKPHVMGHLCNIPDIYWRGLSQESRKYGDPTHFVDPELIGLPVKDIPLDYREIVTKYTGQENKDKAESKIQSVPSEFGSNWWRADQFFRLAINAGKDAKAATPPSNKKEEQDDSLAFNKGVYTMMVSLGLMGHFVGDNSQPLHNTSDYDGYASGHGGIHAYYEDACVSQFGPELQSEIVKKAGKLKNISFMKGKTVLEKMKALALLSVADIKDVLKLDPVTSPSELKLEKGLSLKTAAKRKSSEEGFKKFDKLIIEELARSALLLASLWDEAYTTAGSPDLKSYRSYKYPIEPDFVAPDYFDIQKPDEKTEAKKFEKK